MNETEKRALTSVNKISVFKKTIKNLTINLQLSESDRIYILGCAIIFLKHYKNDKRLTSYAEFAYYIILKYSVYYADYSPLYDFSANFGYYPIVKSIFDNNLVQAQNINDCFLSIEIERFKSESYIETFHQYKEKRNLLSDKGNELSYVAPTSFGKSSVIIDYIQKYLKKSVKIAIVVPTKSLLMQTYRMVRDASVNKKIIIHDEMYQGEKSFIAIFTQERSLRLLSKQELNFDILFIDEAHNILNDDPRSVLLSRLIAKNRALNPKQKIIYLSPLVEDVQNLKITKEQNISEYKIPFNIKEPEIFEYKLNKEVYKYNRFVNEQYKIGTSRNIFSYVLENSLNKNFLYCFRPISIEQLARELSRYMPSNPPVTERIRALIRILKQEVHEKFYAVDYIAHGIVYLHGKLPDLIKEYLESKFRDLPEIKFIIANSVILEGMNLPIDNLYILNTYGLQGKELTNLIGRVNRLNTIFTPTVNNLDKLLPRVHFVNSEEYNRKSSDMFNKIELLRSRTFKDVIENPTLENFDFDKLKVTRDQKDKKKAAINQLQKNEQFLYKVPANEREKLKQYLIETGISDFYHDVDQLAKTLEARIKKVKGSSEWTSLKMLEKIAELFITGINYIKDFEFSRLTYPEARSYYDFHITVGQKRALKENINHMLDNFLRRIKENSSVTYFGKTYGEIARNPIANPSEAKLFIDLKTKNEIELVNLAIVKLKMEDDFVSFKLNKFIIMLHDYELISVDDYNLYIYGTTDQSKISLTKIGLSVSLITRLEVDDQLKYLYFDTSNNLKSRPEFEQYKNSVNDFYKFEIERFLN